MANRSVVHRDLPVGNDNAGVPAERPARLPAAAVVVGLLGAGAFRAAGSAAEQGITRLGAKLPEIDETRRPPDAGGPRQPPSAARQSGRETSRPTCRSRAPSFVYGRPCP